MHVQIIDGQLHEPAIHFDWSDVDTRIRHRVLDEVLIGYMDAVGVQRAVLFPADLSWATALAAAVPDRFRVVPALAPGGQLRSFTPSGVVNRFDPLADDIGDRLRAFAADHPCGGFRMMDRRTLPESLVDRPVTDVFAPVFEACQEMGTPLFMSTANDTATPRAIAEAFPALTLVIDHLGVPQPPVNPRADPPFALLPHLLALAELPNIALKMSGAPTLSEQSFPFADLWPALRALVDAFGADRLMWGSDISRIQGRIGHELTIVPPGEHYDGMHTYAEALHYVRHTDQLSEQERAAILGGTARRLLHWS